MDTSETETRPLDSEVKAPEDLDKEKAIDDKKGKSTVTFNNIGFMSE